MAVEEHIFDVDGDLVLILSRLADAKEDIPGFTYGSADEDSPPDDEVVDTNIPSDLGVSEATRLLDAYAMTIDTSVDPDGVEFEEPGTEVRMLVSAKHMMLVSPVFRAMLQRDTFKEGGELLSKGKVEVPLPDDDVSAFIIILDIIHGRNRRVPRQVSLDMLTSITILVDKYQLVESVEAYSDGWINNPKLSLPQKYFAKEEVLAVHKWISISWVFSLHDKFKSMTKLLELGCYDEIGGTIDEDLPIPEIVIETTRKRRHEALSELYAIIGEAVERCQHNDGMCFRTDSYKNACDAMLLGSLLRSAKSCGIYPTPAPPYSQVSVCQLISTLREIEVVALCDSIRRPRSWSGPEREDSHGIRQMIDERLARIEVLLSGLKLRNLKLQKTIG